ncbi:MAG TPA: polysaccharide biosynthesis/export family protein [Pyrinomonadaceae bacterium]|nr:polysaccharide biosynthesis/export family protein [Pyrinomonadaceae bacterium]
MRSMNLKIFALALAVSACACAAQARQPQQPDKKQARPRTAATPRPSAQSAAERLEPDEKPSTQRKDVPAETMAARHENLAEEEAAANAYANNFLSTYLLGPEDIISITVFGPFQDRYSKAGIVIPPHAIITHQLIPEGIRVAGKTTQQVQDEITKKLDEYIENPKVTVTLDRAQSAVFWVVGDVAKPGIFPMTRRLSVTDALYLSGGVLDTGNKKKVVINRRMPDGFLRPQLIDVAAIERGKQPDNFFLQPGDQVLVPGNRMKTVERWLRLASSVSLFRIFTGGF